MSCKQISKNVKSIQLPDICWATLVLSDRRKQILPNQFVTKNKDDNEKAGRI